MPAGYTAKLSKDGVDTATGKTAQALNVAFRDVADTKAFLDVYQDAELELLGYTPQDIATLRSAYADLDQLRRIFEGAEALPEAKDFTTFAGRIWGTGTQGY